MKYLIDPATYLVKLVCEAPLDFSVSGKMVQDVPSYLTLSGPVGNFSDLTTARDNAFLAQHPSMTGLMTDDFDTAGAVDLTLSSRFTTGPHKRTAALVGGKVVSTFQSFGFDTTRCFFHCSLFKLTHEPQNAFGDRPGPSRLLYEEVAVNSATVSAQLVDLAGTTVLLDLIPDTEQPLILLASDQWRISLTNLTSETLYVGDWIILHG